MPNPTTIAVPLASKNLVARATFELDLLFGDKEPTDAAETITYGTGGKFSHTVNADGSVDFTAISTTVGDTDTATLADDEQTVTVTLTVAEDTATGIEEEGVSYVAPGAAVAA